MSFRASIQVGLGVLLVALAAVSGSGCEQEGNARAPQLGEFPHPAPTFTQIDAVHASNYEVLVRPPMGPGGVAVQAANNNLDAATFAGRTFLAWRTAPTHFASSNAEIVVASEGTDGWRFEGRFSRGTDLREPRLLALRNRLFLYFALLGTDPSAFEPRGAMVTEYHGPPVPGSANPNGTWDEPALLDLGDFIPWRARVVDGRGYLVGYDGGESIYNYDGKPIRVRFLRTDDGRTLSPAWPDRPVSLTGGSSETDFAFLDDGGVVTVSRNEAGDDEHGFGSLICRAEADAPGAFRCKDDSRKFDSPLVFRVGGDVWLVARRNVTAGGAFDLGYGFLPLGARAIAYDAQYSFIPKRCALWRVDPVALTVSWVRDLPSRGDTCFPGMVLRRGHGITLFNYTSPLENASDCPSWPYHCADITWAAGQMQSTNIYRIDLDFP